MQKKDSIHPIGWQNEKIVDQIQAIKKNIEDLNVQADKAERDSNFELVAKDKIWFT